MSKLAAFRLKAKRAGLSSTLLNPLSGEALAAGCVRTAKPTASALSLTKLLGNQLAFKHEVLHNPDAGRRGRMAAVVGIFQSCFDARPIRGRLRAPYRKQCHDWNGEASRLVASRSLWGNKKIRRT